MGDFTHSSIIQFLKTTHFNNYLAKILMTIFPKDGTSVRILFPVNTWANMPSNFLSQDQLFDLWPDNCSIPTAVDLQF